MKIDPDEVVIKGRWIWLENRVIADEVSKRINALVNDYLKEIGRDSSGWNALYLDPTDGRLWELTYPEADSHGGGPPQLRCLASDEAKIKYSNAKFS